MRSFWRGFFFVLAVLAVVGAVTPAEARRTPAPKVVPTPAWVTPIDVDFKSSVDENNVRNGTTALLRDTRIRIGHASVERYQRTVQKAVSSAGVEALAEVMIEFAPDYQELALHHVAVVRNGKVFDQTRRASIRMLDQENDIEHRVYKGTSTALVVLNDVRAGDVVDVAYSIRGLNPVLAGHYAGSVTFGAEEPTRRFYVEVRRDETREKSLKWAVRGQAPAPIESVEGKERVLAWNLSSIPALPDEDRVPATHDVPAELELSELESWSDVASWAQSLYPAISARSLAEKAAELRAGTSDPKEAALRAVRFVQDDVRYLSESLGPFSLRPHPPAQVLKQRFGDCKDKSYFLVELLRALGVEAHPALANTDFREDLDTLLPSAFDFDHAIVKMTLDGRAYFIDPTWSQQGGSLDTEEAPDLGRVLVVAPDTQGLETVPGPGWTDSPHVAVNEFTVDPDGKTALKVVTTYRGSIADEMRAKLAANAISEIAHDYANYYEKEFGKLIEASPLDIHDDRTSNVVVVTEHYVLQQFWKDGERTLVPDTVRGYLSAPNITRRQSPLSLDHPTWIREVHTVKLPFEPELERSENKWDDPAFTFRQLVESTGKEAHATYEYRSLARSVPLAKLESHLKRLDEARDKVGLTLDKAGGPDESSGAKSSSVWAAVIVGSFIVGGALLVPLLAVIERSVRRRRLRLRVETHAGETPAMPIPAATFDQAKAHLGQTRCSCGSVAFVEPADFAEIRYGAEKLHAGTVTCASCGAKSRLYFAVGV
jgi:transglutaminase-like putative cysteine protease